MEHTVFPLGGALLLIGRDLESGILLDSEQISRNHASIVYDNNRYVVRDNGSKNGTFVNGVKASECTLAHNDRIRFGPYEFRVDLEGEDSGLDVPAQEPTNLNRRGREYRQTVNLGAVKGSAQSGPVRIMMARRSPLVGQARAGRIPVPMPTKKRSWRFLRYGALAIIVGVAAFAWFGEWQIKGQSAQEAIKAEADSSKPINPNAEDEARIQKLEEEKARAQETLRKTAESLQNSTAQIMALKEEKAKIQEEFRQVSADLKKDDGELPDLKRNGIATNADPKEAAKPALLTSREEIAKKLEPVKDLPRLEYPPKVTVVKAIEIPIVVNDHVAGSRKVPEGRSFVVVGVEQESILVDMTGEIMRMAKDQTDFQTALDNANLSRQKENERLHSERERLIDAMLKEEAASFAQAEKEKASLMKSAVSLTLKVQEILNGGLIGVTPSGVKVFLTGGDSNNVVAGETWKGDAFPMGVVIQPKSDIKCRHYTSDFKEYAAFIKSGANEDEASRSAQEPTEKDAKEIEAQITEIIGLIRPDQMIKDVDTLLADSVKRSEQWAHVAAQSFFKTESPKLKTAANIALEASKQTFLNGPTTTFFADVIAMPEMCVEHRLRNLSQQLRKIDREALALKASFVVNPKTNEKKN